MNEDQKAIDDLKANRAWNPHYNAKLYEQIAAVIAIAERAIAKPETWPKYYEAMEPENAHVRCERDGSVIAVSCSGYEQVSYMSLAEIEVRKQLTLAEAMARVKTIESPDDWVTQDRVPARNLDQFRWSANTKDTWFYVSDFPYNSFVGRLRHGEASHATEDQNNILEVRCRRKDLPKHDTPFIDKMKSIERVQNESCVVKIPVRLWGIRANLDLSGMALLCCPAECESPHGSADWVEVKTDSDGKFYVEGPQ